MFSRTRLPNTVVARSLRSGQSITWRLSRPLSTQPEVKTSAQPKIKADYKDPSTFLTTLTMSQTIKKRNVKLGRGPSLPRYLKPLNACAANELSKEAMALLEDMEACGVVPDTLTYNLALRACMNDPKNFRTLLYRMDKQGIERNTQTYSRVINHRLRDGDLELALQDVREMLVNGFQLNENLIDRLVWTASVKDHPRLAIDLLQVYEAGSEKTASPACWIRILQKAVELQWDDGIQTCLERLKGHEMKMTEGTISALLRHASRTLDLKFAQSMLLLLNKKGIEPKEHHLTPLIRMYVKRKDIDGVFEIFDRMVQGKIQPTANSMEAFGSALFESQDKALIQRCYEIMETYKDQGKEVPAALLTGIIRGNAFCATEVDSWIRVCDDIQSYNPQPDIRAYEGFLYLCTQTRDETRAYRIYDDILARMAELAQPEPEKAKRFRPSALAFKYLAWVAVRQKSYEAAFHWLEETKAAGYKPEAEFYAFLIRRCVRQKDPRWAIAYDEMKAQGHSLKRLETFLRSHDLLPSGPGEKSAKKTESTESA